MKLADIKKRKAGDEVFWTDPDNGIGSRFYTIKTIEVKGDVVSISDVSGDNLECYARELS